MPKQSDTTDPAQSALADWDTHATVRTQANRYAIDAEALDELGERGWFDPRGLPFMDHPRLAGLSERERQQMLGRIRLQFFEYGAVLEHEIVNLTTLDLVQRDHGLNISDATRVDAYKVYADEAYHSLLSMQAAEHVKRYIGASQRTWPLRDGRLDAIRAAIHGDCASDSDVFLRRFGATVLTEIMISKELADSLQGVVIQPIYHLLRDHLHDESRHALFFAALFGVVWAQLTRRDQTVLGVALPSLLLAFNQHDELGLLDALTWIGFTEAEALEISSESYPSDHALTRANARATNVFHVLRRHAVFEIPEVREAFLDAGFRVAG